MEIPIQVAVRIFPCAIEDNEELCIQSISTPAHFSPTHGLIGASASIQIQSQSYPITHSLPFDCSQNQLYHQTVYPLISLFLEGFDASVITYGQKGTGKTYTIIGNTNLNCLDDDDNGIIQRSIHEIFTQLSANQSRNYEVNIGWIEIINDEVHDLLQSDGGGGSNVYCQNYNDVLHWLQIGLRNQSNINGTHNLFTITLEQRWINNDGLIQHRLSTASFCDLCSTERMYVLNNHNNQHTSIPKNLGLQALETIVNTLTDPSIIYNLNDNNYQQQLPSETTITTLLKDSFGGRAQTLIILCVSPLERDINETISNIEFVYRTQCIRNYVIMNTFSDNNTPISPEIINNTTQPVIIPASAADMITDPNETFGLQFAASQWLKLVSNAEGLFAKLLGNKTVSDVDREQIEEWIFLKQECEECLSSGEVIRCEKQLVPIQETEEPDDVNSDDLEISCQQNSDNDSDSESQRPDLNEKIDGLITELRIKTDKLVRGKYDEFIKAQPKAVMESNESFRPDERRTSSSMGGGGRRRSIHPGASLSSSEIAMLNRVATREPLSSRSPDDFLDSSVEYPIRLQNSPLDNIQKQIRKIETDIDAKQRQFKELEQTVLLKQKLITDLIKNNDTRTTAKQRFNKKKGKLETEYEKTKKQLSKAVVNNKDKMEIERLKLLTSQMEQRLQDLASIKHIAGESGQKVKKLQESVVESKKQLEALQKNLKKERKIKDQLETELKSLKDKDNSNSKSSYLDDKTKNLKEVQARITHLDHVLKEKSQNLEQFKNTEEQESLRHEIRNLRRTRDHLLEQRCSLDRKLKKDKTLSHREERKLLECDEAIEAIDAAIEFKNEMICGRKSIDTSERLQREKGEQMLMARLNKLSSDEMRTLLYKYFTKVIDLRDSSRKLEVQLMSLERERDAWEWRERVLSNAVRQARLEGERNAVLLQRQHETKLTLMLRHLAEETSASSSFNDINNHHPRISYPLPIVTHGIHSGGGGNHHVLTHAPPTSPQQYNNCSDSDYDLDLYHKNAQQQQHHLHSHGHKQILKNKHAIDMDLCPIPDSLTKYKPLDKIKEKDRETKNKLFAKFQVLTRYHGSTSSNNINDKKNKNLNQQQTTDPSIPQENLKQLISTPSATKVTRQKNKIIIQDSSRK